MRTLLCTALVFASLTASVLAETPTWKPGGTVTVNSKAVTGASFLESGRHRVFPVLAIAAALGRKASVDASKSVVTWDGKDVKVTSLVTVDGVAYLGWRDLTRLEPQMQYGLSGGKAVFSLGQTTAAKAPSGAQTQGTSAGDSAAGEAVWLEDFNAASSQARSTGKRMLLDFTGSDWCGWCKKLDAEVFQTPEFKAYAARKLILVKIDFPRQIAQSDALKKQNAELQVRFNIAGFPTLFILSPEGQTVGKTGYLPGGPQALIETIEAMK
ncbi:MAG: DUF255 domain-containing protein [Proteobacteria bacterium]|nr:DUF255 domain-containing protein [Pseudomonadota bacterium]